MNADAKPFAINWDVDPAMKKLAFALGILAAIAIAFMFNVLHATQQPLAVTPDPLVIAAQQLHAQLVASEQRETEIEKQDWNSIPLLNQLIGAHQQRIVKLAGNNQAGEIIAHDHEAIARLERRIHEIGEQEAERPAAPAPERATHQ